MSMDCVFWTEEGCFICDKCGTDQCPEKIIKPVFVKENGKYYQIKDGVKIERWDNIFGRGVLLSKDMTIFEQTWFMCWKQTNEWDEDHDKNE